jgi:hypothetical protein|tara:strand:- start:2468 stop:2683 length:216 start_codon:yes stop_codon:yes gene_type:complete
MTKEEKTTRIHKLLADILDKIKKKRLDKGKDKKKISDRKLTGLIARHDLWKEIEIDIINLEIPKIKKVLNE